MLRSEPDEKGRMHEGFMIDLLDLIAEKLKFDYVVYEVADRKYGAEVTPGNWNGMVGELMHRDSSKVSNVLYKIRLLSKSCRTFVQNVIFVY